jgi:hypothetical protein
MEWALEPLAKQAAHAVGSPQRVFTLAVMD